jgi:opacity protein-like surface antigen
MTSPSSISARLGAAAFLAFVGAGTTVAADFPGSFGVFTPAAAPFRWDGYVGGGQVGTSNYNADFGSAGGSLVSYILRNTTVENEFAPSGWTTLSKTTTNSRQYGFFLGYNTQWDRLVLGVDGSYNRPQSLTASSSDTISRIVTTSDGTQHIVTINAMSSLKLIDYATARVRAGYAIGQVLPYAAVGIAAGRFDYATSATVKDIWTPTGGVATTFGPITETDGKNGAFSAGVAVAAGIDALVLPNVFVRAEWEYVAFGPLSGVRSQLNTGRVGVGLKF